MNGLTPTEELELIDAYEKLETKCTKLEADKTECQNRLDEAIKKIEIQKFHYDKDDKKYEWYPVISNILDDLLTTLKEQ